MKNHYDIVVSICFGMATIGAALLAGRVSASDDNSMTNDGQNIAYASQVDIVRFARPSRGGDEVMERGQRLLNVLTAANGEGSLQLASMSKEVLEAVDGTNRFRIRAQVGESPNLNMQYLSDVDSIEVYDTILPTIDPAFVGIERDQADSIFQETFDSLVAKGLISEDRAQASNVIQGGFERA